MKRHETIINLDEGDLKYLAVSNVAYPDGGSRVSLQGFQNRGSSGPPL
jgi:hypothetical protein